MRRTFGGLAALVILGAVAQSWYVVSGAGLDGPQIAGFLARHHAVGYAIGLWWVMVAPVPLVAAALATRRTPWPWVVVITTHLAVLVAVAVRLHHLLPVEATAAVATTAVLGVGAAMAAVRVRS